MHLILYLPEAVRANCSRADSDLGILESSVDSVRRFNEDPDLVITSIAFSIFDFESPNGVVDETVIFCVAVAVGREVGWGRAAAVCAALANAVFSANLPFGL